MYRSVILGASLFWLFVSPLRNLSLPAKHGLVNTRLSTKINHGRHPMMVTPWSIF